jgi:hypothetical protein
MTTSTATKIMNPIGPTIIQYVDGLCGSGKTHSLREYITSNWGFQSKYMIITPSKKLADQIYGQLAGSSELDNVCLIHSDKTDNVVADIISAIKDIDFDGTGIIICTQQVFTRIPFFQNKNTWTLIVDEIPKIDDFYNPSLPHNHGLITNFIEVDHQVTPTLYK